MAALFATLYAAPTDPYTASSDLTLVAAFLSYAGFLGFSFFSVVSYGLFRALRQADLLETVQAIPKGFRRTQGHFARWLLLEAAAYFFLLFLLSMLLFTRGGWTPPGALTLNILCAALLYGGIPALSGVLWGFAGHFRTNRLVFGLLTFCAAFLASPIATELYISAGSFGNTLGGERLGACLQTALGFFYCLVPVYDRSLNVTYGLSIELYRWGTALFWLVMLSGIALTQLRKLRAAGIACLVLCLPIAAFSVQSRSMGMTGLYVDLPTIRREDNDGMGNYKYQSEAGETPAFQVVDYRLDFTFSDMLHADATLLLSEDGLPQYAFTLYHGYEVSDVTDGDGKALSYSQENDRLLVYPNQGEPLNAISLRYSGWNNIYYSNWQGAYLPSFSYYYPIAGCHEMYTDPNTDTASFTVSCNRDSFVNLERNGGLWVGEANALNIVSGMYRTADINGVQYIVPWDAEATDLLQPLSQELAQHAKDWRCKYAVDEIQYVVYSPMANLPYRYKADDSAVCGNTLFAVYAPYSPMTAKNLISAFVTEQASDSAISYWYGRLVEAAANGEELLQTFTVEFGTLYDGEYQHLPAISEALDNRREVGYYLAHAIERWGEEKVMHAIAEYLDGGAQEDAAFAKKLWLEGTE